MRKPAAALLTLLALASVSACNDGRLLGGEGPADPADSPNPDPSQEPTGPTPVPTFPGDPTPPAEQYLGFEFWAVDLDLGNVFPSFPSEQTWGLAVSNPSADEASVDVVDADGAAIATTTLASGETKVIPMPTRNVDGSGLVPYAFRVRSTQPVTVHQINPLDDVGVFSGDASLLLPVTALGTRYRVLTWPQYGAAELRSYLTVVAPETATVTVTVTARTIAGGDLPSLEPGQSVTRTLQPFDVLTLETRESQDDLSGSLVTSDVGVVVFGGTEASYVPLGVCCGDHLEEQLPPEAAWGRDLVAGRALPRGSSPDVYRILAAGEGTVVTTDPAQPGTPATLGAGQVLTLTVTEDFAIHAAKPVLVGHFLVGQDYGGGTGDPSFVLLPPREQLLHDQMFHVPEGYATNFVTVVAPLGAALELDGDVIFPEWSPAGASGYGRANIDVLPGAHRVRGTHPLQVEVMGYDSYISYGYSGGAGLIPLQ